MRNTIITALLVATSISLTACDSVSSNEEPPAPLETVLVENLAADPAERNPATGEALERTGRYTLFSLRDNEIVLSYSEPNRADSASTSWDIGFRGTSIIANGGTSGPGDGGVQLLEGVFEEIDLAPTSGYEAANSSWYSYDMNTHVISPTPGRVLAVRTADGRYAKIRILSYYKDAPDNPTLRDPTEYYTFEYIYQPDGSTDFSVAE